MTFDASAFMEQTVDSPLETVLKPVGLGEWQAMIDDFKADDKTFRKVEVAGEDRIIFRCPFVIIDEAEKARLGRDKLVVNQDIWLDFESDGVTLKTGGDANVKLGQLRAAVGQNGPEPWTFARLRNAGPVKVTVKHRPDKDDPSIKYAEVAKVGRA